MGQYKKILTLAILSIIRYSIAWYLAGIILEFIENHHLSSSTSFIRGTLYILFALLFCIIFDNILDLIVFIDTVELYVNGCECDKERNYNSMISQYNDIKNNQEMVNHLTKCFECDRIRFQ